MALPAVLLKAKGALKKAGKAKQVVDAAKAANDASDGQLGEATKKIGLAGCGCFVVPLFLLLLLVITALSSIFGTIQLADGATMSHGNLIYSTEQIEDYYLKSQQAFESGNIPEVDLQNTEYQTVANFNEHIKSSVQQAGYGTREGVVTAGLALVGDYIVATGKRLRYDQSGRQSSDVEGIVNSNFYLDCSSFAWWALYNGGFNTPSYPYTVTQMDWAESAGCLESTDNGQAGDFLVSTGHIILIIGNYDGGYYCAEFSGWGTGAIISKRDKSSLNNYYLINMESYYNDSSNVR